MTIDFGSATEQIKQDLRISMSNVSHIMDFVYRLDMALSVQGNSIDLSAEYYKDLEFVHSTLSQILALTIVHEQN